MVHLDQVSCLQILLHLWHLLDPCSRLLRCLLPFLVVQCVPLRLLDQLRQTHPLRQ